MESIRAGCITEVSTVLLVEDDVRLSERLARAFGDRATRKPPWHGQTRSCWTWQ